MTNQSRYTLTSANLTNTPEYQQALKLGINKVLVNYCNSIEDIKELISQFIQEKEFLKFNEKYAQSDYPRRKRNTIFL